MVEQTLTRGFLSSVTTTLFFGLGKDTLIDEIEVIWPSGKKNKLNKISVNQTIEIDIRDAEYYTKEKDTSSPLFQSIDSNNLGIDYLHKENEFDDWKEQILLPHRLSQNGPFTTVGDINGDQLDDLFIGGAKGQSGELYIQTNDGKFIKNKSQPWAKDKDSEDLGCLFFDANGDGKKDLYVASGGNEYDLGDKALADRLYINDGVGNFKKSKRALPDINESTQCVKSADIDKDGDLDLFVGNRLIPGKYTFPASSYLLINENGIFKKADKEIAAGLQDIGMVTDAVFTDINNDGNTDLIVVGEWMEIKLFINIDGKFVDRSLDYGLKDSRGIWWSITAGDLDGDGDDDYVLGNLGKNNKFKATEEHPFKVYANDFDDNGTNDVVLAKFYKDDYVPVRGRECTSQQMPYVEEKFGDYHSFASSKLLDILPEDKIEQSVKYEIKGFENIVLMNENNQLVKQKLPNAAQVSPIKSSIIKDVNKDGISDIIIVGNHYGVEVETTRYDAGHGNILLGTKERKFKSIHPKMSGFYCPFDSRNLIEIKVKGKDMLIVSNNNSELELFNIR